MFMKIPIIFLIVLLIFSLTSASKKDKKSEPDYYDKPLPKELPSTIDLKRCKLNQDDCIEHEFFTLSNYLEPNASLKAKRARFNRWMRHYNFSGFYLDEFIDSDRNFSQTRLFYSVDKKKIELILNDSQYIHEDSFNMRYFKDTYLIYMHFQIPKLDYKSPINKLVSGILYHTAYSLDSIYEEWIYTLPASHKGLLVTLLSEEIELLKGEKEVYKFIKEKRKEYIDDYYDFVDRVHEIWMRYHPQIVKDYFRRPNVTMSDYIWARHLIEIRKIEVEFQGKKKNVILPFLEFSGIDTYLKQRGEFPPIQQSQTCFMDNEGFHIVLDGLKLYKKTGVFHDCLYKKPHPYNNFFYLLMHGIIPEINPKECIQVLLIPNEIARTIPRHVFTWLIAIKYPGIGMCLNEKVPDIMRRLQFIGYLVNLSPTDMEEIAATYKVILSAKKPDYNNDDEFNASLEALPKPQVLTVDYRETAYKSIDEYERKYRTFYDQVEEYIKTNGTNERVELIKKYFEYYLNMAGNVRKIVKKSMSKYDDPSEENTEEEKNVISEDEFFTSEL